MPHHVQHHAALKSGPGLPYGEVVADRLEDAIGYLSSVANLSEQNPINFAQSQRKPHNPKSKEGKMASTTVGCLSRR